MSDQQAVIEQITKALTQQKLRMQQMLQTLDIELEAVKQRDGKAITTVSEQKEQALQQIVKADQELGAEQIVDFIKRTPSLLAIKDDITELLKQCQHQNEVIYLTATQNQVAIEDVKRLLIGGSKNTTYDAYGQKQAGSLMGKGLKA